jgi:hypothetical protein
MLWDAAGDQKNRIHQIPGSFRHLEDTEMVSAVRILPNIH